MATIEFINGSNKTYGAMKRVIEYILNPEKTNQELTGGHNCDVNNANLQFVLTKRNFNKETGRQYIHFVQSFAPYDKATPEILKSIADELVKMEAFNGFEIAYAVHTDKPHLHTHFVLNTVNAGDGHKWKQGAEGLQQLKDFSDDLCRKYGLIITQGKPGNHVNRGEHRTKVKGKSWKYELFLAVKHAKWCSKSREEFVTNMNQLGYKVDWSDTRTYITFTNSQGKKCRNRKLYPPEKFTKEALLKTFELNQQKADDQQDRARMNLLLGAIQLLQEQDPSETTQHFPLSCLEGEDLKNEVEEMKKGKGLDWDKERGQEI